MLRGSKSRNKVSVGEPAEGSLPTSKRVAPQLSGCVCARFFPPHVNLRCVPHSFQHPLQQSTDRTLAHVCVCVSLFRESRTHMRAWLNNTPTKTKLLTMDILVLATMKNAAKCDTQCELQNSVNHQNFERILRSEVFLRACLSQWHLPLSPVGFLHETLADGRQDCEPSGPFSS
jgi:hypothetical protein